MLITNTSKCANYIGVRNVHTHVFVFNLHLEMKDLQETKHSHIKLKLFIFLKYQKSVNNLIIIPITVTVAQFHFNIYALYNVKYSKEIFLQIKTLMNMNNLMLKIEQHCCHCT